MWVFFAVPSFTNEPQELAGQWRHPSLQVIKCQLPNSVVLFFVQSQQTRKHFRSFFALVHADSSDFGVKWELGSVFYCQQVCKVPGLRIFSLLLPAWLMGYGISLHSYESLKSERVSCSLQPHGLQPTGLLCPWNPLGRILEWVATFSFRESS